MTTESPPTVEHIVDPTSLSPGNDWGPLCHCGLDMEWIECWDCGGEGEHEMYEIDPLWYDEGDTDPCETCQGKGGHWLCSSLADLED